MKHRFRSSLLLALSLSVILTLPAFPSGFNKLTIAQLEELLSSLQRAKKSDDQVASQLSAVELTEQLTSVTMHSMGGLIAGPLSTEQMYVLEARSSMLAPPVANQPIPAALAPADQQALLAKAQDYATKAYAQLPPITAIRMTARFQDGVQTIQSYTGAKVRTTNDQDPIFQDSSLTVHLKNTHTDNVELKHGLTQPVSKEKIAWGSNGLVTSMLPPMALPDLLQQIAANGAPAWQRWELIDGKQAAVFSFAVDKKKSRYTLDYCCFPETANFGNDLYHADTTQASNSGNLATVSEWKNFTAKSSYRGQLFLDPDTGTVLRTIVQADFKPSDFVHSEQIRVDYAAVPIASHPLVVPVRTFTLTEIVPNGDSFAAKFAARHDLVTEDFKDFTLASSGK